MNNTEKEYVTTFVWRTAAAAIEYSPLNTDRASREHHTAMLVTALLRVTQEYITTNTVSE